MPANPSLKGLQAFEAATRTGSFASAAKELSVSQAAISQSIKSLETQIDRKLFHRINRSVVPTEAGLEIYPRLNAVFDEIRGISRQLAGSGPKSRLVVSVPPSAVVGWLSKRLPRIGALTGVIDISVRGEEDPVDFESDLIDIRLSYGQPNYRFHKTSEIITDSVYPVCSPDYARSRGPFNAPESLLKVDLIHTVWGASTATFPSWRSWFDHFGYDAGSNLAGGTVANSSLAAVDFAVNGLGIALSQGLFVSDLIREGKLLRLFDHGLELSQAYCLTIPKRSATRSPVVEFADWFKAEIQASVNPDPSWFNITSVTIRS